MRLAVAALAASLLLFYPAAAIPVQWDIAAWWPGEFGMPCTTATDRKELANENGECVQPIVVVKPARRRAYGS